MNELLSVEKGNLARAGLAIFVTSLLNLGAPSVLAYAIDHYLTAGDYRGVLRCGGLLLAMYLTAFVTQYFQSLWMGSVGQRVVYRARGQVFHKLQELPVAFFQQHQTGDLISRINNDTNKLNEFFSQSLMRFIGSLVTMVGSALFLLGINPRLGAAALAPAVGMLVLTRVISPLVKSRNALSMKSAGELSAEVSQGLENFKAVVAFDRRDYFREHFQKVNAENFRAALGAGIANGVLTPLYGLCSQLAQLLVLVYGLVLIGRGEFTVGFLIGYFVYVQRLYDPMRQLAALWATFQAARAGYDRIAEILKETNDLVVVPSSEPPKVDAPRLEFREVGFAYAANKPVLQDVSFRLEPGRTYAFVGPTGGGKTTTASLMARLFDPKQGKVLLDGRDIRSYESAERTRKVGFILQDPFLFAGTLRDNIDSLEGLDAMFDKGLDTPIEGLSLGQRQVVAFLRAVTRRPELLILDEATANIDTVTEKTLDGLLQKLPETTTRVIIAHRFGTIENADQIFFVNAGRVEPAGSIDHAVTLLRNEQRSS